MALILRGLVKKSDHLAYNKLEGKSPTVVFLSGFNSDMEGTKAQFAEGVCREIGHAFIRFDYFGHGKSDGAFKDGTISQWKNDALKVIDELTEGPLILIGSSMGGWLMMLAALERPERIKALIGMAAAADFTEELMRDVANPAQLAELEAKGFIEVPNCYEGEPTYPITKNLLDDGRKHLLLKSKIQITCPVTLLHGMADKDVPYKTAIRIADNLIGKKVNIHLIKNADHRLNEPENLALLRTALIDMISS